MDFTGPSRGAVVEFRRPGCPQAWMTVAQRSRIPVLLQAASAALGLQAGGAGTGAGGLGLD